jgi:hypothetical protein
MQALSQLSYGPVPLEARKNRSGRLVRQASATKFFQIFFTRESQQAVTPIRRRRAGCACAGFIDIDDVHRCAGLCM